jgi:hypothetical protein
MRLMPVNTLTAAIVLLLIMSISSAVQDELQQAVPLG